MRIRSIKPEFFQDEKLAELPYVARILFAGLWGLADRRGRLEDRPKYIKINVLPYDNEDVEALLCALAGLEFIIRYVIEIDGRPVKLIQIINFEKHQKINGKEMYQESHFPGPKREETPKLPFEDKEEVGSDSEATENPQGSYSVQKVQARKGRERKGKEGIEDSAEASPSAVENPLSKPISPDKLFSADLKAAIDGQNLRDGKPWYANWGMEGKALKRLESMIRSRASPEGDLDKIRDFARRYLNEAKGMKDRGEFPMKAQPFTASYLSSGGVFTRIAEKIDAPPPSADWVDQYLEEPGNDG